MPSSSRQPRVLFLTKSDGIGGVERNLTWLVPGLRDRGFAVDLCLIEVSEGKEGLLGNLGPTSLKSRQPFIRGFARLLEVRRILRDNCYDAVVGTGPAANLLLSLGIGRNRARVVIAEQNDPYISRRRSWNKRWLWAMRRADVVTVHTEGLANELRRDRRYPKQIAVIPNALTSEAKFTESTSPRALLICGAGRITAQKGFDTLMRSFADLGDTSRGWKLMIVGDGPQRSELESLAQRLGIEDRFQITGMVDRPWELMSSASIFVSSSVHEGFGNVILEAMAAGCAIIVSDCRFGPREIVRHGKDGLVFETADIEDLTTSLAKLILSPGLRYELAANGQKRVSEFIVDRVVDQWEELLGFELGPSNRSLD